MIASVRIENFKSIVDLRLNLGSFNVLIGENGSGKSNILEAIAFGAAANAGKLDHEFFGSRGIRVTSPEFMFSAFNNEREKTIKISYQDDVPGKSRERDYKIQVDPENTRKWITVSNYFSDQLIEKIARSVLYTNESDALASAVNESGVVYENKQLYNEIFQKLKGPLPDSIISDFIIYSPEQTCLRKFEDTDQIYPLGINGEGLFQYLKEISVDRESDKLLADIKENLLLLDWYEDFHMSQSVVSTDFSLQIKDKYLDSAFQYFDQRSTNEGFLFLLFYSTLFSSKITPTFFAIDNIDVSFNPKLCMRIVQNLVKLAKQNNKQVIVTAQNPAILDGLDLSDSDQRLFVVRRNEDGHTKATRVEHKAERKMKLSEIWTNGYIGGLPENF